MGVFSGCMLIMAGVLVWHMRSGYKDLQATNKEIKSHQDKQLVHIVWRQSFNCGHKIIDDQHRSLFIDANRIIDAIANYKMDMVINEALNELIRDIQTHFRTEDAFLEKFAPEIAGLHKEKHAKLFQEMHVVIDRVRHKDASPRELVGFLVFDVVTNHLVREDLIWQEMVNQEDVTS
jgi:hemerythrin-like metal-binding protein